MKRGATVAEGYQPHGRPWAGRGDADGRMRHCVVCEGDGLREEYCAGCGDAAPCCLTCCRRVRQYADGLEAQLLALSGALQGIREALVGNRTAARLAIGDRARVRLALTDVRESVTGAEKALRRLRA